MNDKDEFMTLKQGDNFTLNQQDKDSLFNGLSIYIKNNGKNLVKVSADDKSITILIEKNEK